MHGLVCNVNAYMMKNLTLLADFKYDSMMVQA